MRWGFSGTFMAEQLDGALRRGLQSGGDRACDRRSPYPRNRRRRPSAGGRRRWGGPLADRSNHHLPVIRLYRKIEHLALIAAEPWRTAGLAAGSPSAYAADTTGAGSRRRAFGIYKVHLCRNHPWDGRRWACNGESWIRGPTCSCLSEACGILVVTWIKWDGVKTFVWLVIGFLQL